MITDERLAAMQNQVEAVLRRDFENALGMIPMARMLEEALREIKELREDIESYQGDNHADIGHTGTKARI